jgi:hypothetical protein
MDLPYFLGIFIAFLILFDIYTLIGCATLDSNAPKKCRNPEGEEE